MSNRPMQADWPSAGFGRPLIGKVLDTRKQMPENRDAAVFKAPVIDSNRDAFELFQNTCDLIEVAITQDRDISEPYARALDLLFIQAYKSFTALYLLGVRGHGEDAATILRRLLEISLQVGYLANDPDQQSLRGKQYLAYYWAQVPLLLKRSLDGPTRNRLQALYRQYEHLLSLDKKGRARNWWSGSVRDLAERLGLVETYDQDYRLMSQMAHATTQGILLDLRSSRIEIRSDLMVREIWVFGSRYMLGVALEWNNHFHLINEEKWAVLRDEGLQFSFGELRDREDQSGV